MSRHPEVKWAQRSDKLYITIELPDAVNPKVNIEQEGKFTFSAIAGKDQLFYALDMELYDKVNVKESKISIGLRNIICIIQKQEKKWWKQLLKIETKRLPFLKVDWDKWVDEDEEQESKFGPDLDFGGMDFSRLGIGGDEPLNDDAAHDLEGDDLAGDDFLGDDLAIDEKEVEVGEEAEAQIEDSEDIHMETEKAEAKVTEKLKGTTSQDDA